ncbi:MAG: hypothetical protein P0Y51_16005 [Candidatus Pseudomonas colombiensis]|nr:MAG: hypothetical protein P0Y51_16005 [Pseudomonas sp.]
MALKLAVILIGGLAGNALAEVPHDPPNSLEKAFSMTGVAPSITTIFTTDLSSEEKMLKWSQAPGRGLPVHRFGRSDSRGVFRAGPGPGPQSLFSGGTE